MQDNGWCRVGAQGRHRHVPSQQGNRAGATPKSLLRSNLHQPIHILKAETTNKAPADCQISLLALPAPALASIFQHLDSVAGFRLAQTCRTCEIEFAQQRSDFINKAWKELAPKVTRDPPGPPKLAHSHPYGTRRNPVSMHLKWEEYPGSALRRLYAISQQPDHVHLVNEMWRQAWPKTLWSDLLCDGMPEEWPAIVENDWGPGHTMPSINIEIQVASDERLSLPWNWLALLLLYAPAAGLRHYFNTNAPQLREETPYWNEFAPMVIDVSLQRPARADKSQLIMYKGFINISEFWSGGENVDDTCEVGWHYNDAADFPDTVHVVPSNMQQVAITGSWSRVLPDASCPLWRTHQELDFHQDGLTEGDDIAVDLWDVYLANGFDECQCFEYSSDFSSCLFPPISVSTDFTPFTCEVAGQSVWHPKRQKAKQQAKVRRATRRKSKTGKRTLFQASLTCQDIDWVIE